MRQQSRRSQPGAERERPQELKALAWARFTGDTVREMHMRARVSDHR